MVRIALYLIALNFIEYALHRWPMHRRYGGWLFEHVTLHHAAFPPSHLRITSRHDMAAVFLPPYVVAGILVLIGALAWALSDWTFAACGVAYYLMYEVLQFSAHKGWIGGHHLRHHANSTGNFNITVPLFDWVFSTTIKKRPRLVRDRA